MIVVHRIYQTVLLVQADTAAAIFIVGQMECVCVITHTHTHMHVTHIHTTHSIAHMYVIQMVISGIKSILLSENDDDDGMKLILL